MQKPLRTDTPDDAVSITPVVSLLASGDEASWDAFVKLHPQSTLYHLSGWQNVIEKAYNHRTYYLLASRKDSGSDATGGGIVGVLPLVHLKHFLFGNMLVSMPFLDSGGVLAKDDLTANVLLESAIKLGRKLKAKSLELRHTEPLEFIGTDSLQGINSISRRLNSHRLYNSVNDDLNGVRCGTKSHKVRMLLDLPGASDRLMKSFKAKLRSQIKKPIKEGLAAKIGGVELLDDFYRVFSENMRDLGSPVHSKYLIKNVFEAFSSQARITIVYRNDRPVASSVMIGFKQILGNPWSSALRRYSGLSPNMLLYWTMLEYACNQGFSQFDFGRSSPDEGTYKFKEQWGAKPEALHWHYFSLQGSAEAPPMDKTQFSRMIEYWKKLPVPVTKIVGPMIRKHIGL